MVINYGYLSHANFMADCIYITIILKKSLEILVHSVSAAKYI